MENTLVSFETAKSAKEKGFDWETYNIIVISNSEKEISIGHLVDHKIHPLLKYVCQQPYQNILQKWLRDEHNIVVYCKPDRPNIGDMMYCIEKQFEEGIIKSEIHMTYELALEAGLQEALKLI